MCRLRHLVLRRPPPPPRSARGRRARRTGRRGERAAVRALRRAGYRILARNLRTPRGEIDVLALEGPLLVVVEVKTRSGPNAHPERYPDVCVRGAQIRRLRAAGRWLRGRTRGPRRAVRYDLVAVTLRGRRAETRIHRGHF